MKKSVPAKKLFSTEHVPASSEDGLLFSKILRAVPGLIAVYNINTGKYTYISDALPKILGYTKEEWLTKGLPFVTTLVHPDDMPLIAKKNEDALRIANSKKTGSGNDPIIAFEYRMKHKKGHWVWLKTDGVVFDRTSDGKVKHVMNISVDITGRKEAEIKESLSRKEAERLTKRSEIVLDTMSDACVILDKELRYIYVNKRAEHLMQIKRDQLLGKKVTEAIPEAKKTTFFKYAKKAMQTQKPIQYDSLSPILNKWVEVKYFPSPDGLAFYFTDISDRKKAEEDRTKLAAIVENSNDAIVSKDLNSIITSWNEAAEKMFGYKAQEVVGKSIKITIPKELKAQEEEIIKQLKEGKRIEHFETVRMTKDGRLLDVSLTISPIKNDEGKIIGASNITRDITEQKRLEKQRDDFVSIATHELKTPVTSVKAYAQVLQSIFLKKEDKKSAAYLSKMDSQLNKLTSLIGDLLDVNKLQSGQVHFVPEFFDIDELIIEIVEELQRTTQKHRIVKNLGAKKKVFADRDRVGQVLTNLISNAIKYSPNANKITISSKAEKNHVEIVVRDFGIGIPKDKLDRVFDKFFRISGPKNETFPGMGLGLHISSEFVKRQGGKIWAQSIVGKGSTFSFTLPLGAQKQQRK